MDSEQQLKESRTLFVLMLDPLDKMSAAAVVTGLVIFLLILGLWKAWGKGGAE